MTYNIHPIFVHFPIALLFIYSLVKILPVRRWFPKVNWHDIEVFTLFFGVLGAFAALATGDTAEHLARPNRALVDMHSNFAGLATGLYGALLAGEIARWFNACALSMKPGLATLKKLTVLLEKILCNKTLSIILAVLALIAISVTGLLGGVMVYGTSADPFAAGLLKILGITL
jgi:uncharacterized membrane protein